jgi:hypothetical protein
MRGFHSYIQSPPSCSFSFPLRYPATDTDGDQHQRQQTMRANHAVFDPIFIQYIIVNTNKPAKNNNLIQTPTMFMPHFGSGQACTNVDSGGAGATAALSATPTATSLMITGGHWGKSSRNNQRI